MLVRVRKEADLLRCVTVLVRVHEQDGYPDRWPDDPAAWLSGEQEVASWVAVDGETVIGHVALARDGKRSDRVEIVRLFTDPLRRGSGVGRALNDAALAYAHERGGTAWLEVVASTAVAVAFYQRTGWQRTGSATAEWTAADGTHPTLLRFERAAWPAEPRQL